MSWLLWPCHIYIPANFFWVKCVRFSPCHDLDFRKRSSNFQWFSEDFQTLLKMFEDVPTTSKHFQSSLKTTMFVCFDFIRTQSHHSSPFWNIFVEIEMNFCYWSCEKNVCPDLWVRWEELSLMSKIDVFSPQVWDSPIMHENWQVYIHRHEKILCHGSTCCKMLTIVVCKPCSQVFIFLQVTTLFCKV